MSFGDEIFKALTGRVTHPASASEMFEEVEQYRLEIGMSRRAFARQSGIPESTLRTWGQRGFSTKSGARNLPRLTMAYRALISSPAAIERWRANDMTLHIAAMPQQRRSQEPMDIHVSRLKLDPETGSKVVAAFLRGDDAGAARAFMLGVGEPWYRKVLFGNWIASHDDDLADLVYEGSDYEDSGDYDVMASAS